MSQMNKTRFSLYIIIVSLICAGMILLSSFDFDTMWSFISVFALYFLLVMLIWISESKKEFSKPYTLKKFTILLSNIVIVCVFMWYVPNIRDMLHSNEVFMAFGHASIGALWAYLIHDAWHFKRIG